MLHRKSVVVQLTERTDAGDDVAEIVQQTTCESRKTFFPRTRGQAVLGNFLPCDVEPHAFVAEQQAIAGADGRPDIEEIKMCARLRIEHAVNEAERFPRFTVPREFLIIDSLVT